MSASSSRPLGVVVCVVAAAVFAAPTLFLPADTHASVKLVFIVGGSVLFIIGAMRIRREGEPRRRPPAEDADEDLTPE